MRIDSWLMSCRVFSRTCEEFMLEALIEAVTELGCKRTFSVNTGQLRRMRSWRGFSRGSDSSPRRRKVFGGWSFRERTKV